MARAGVTFLDVEKAVLQLQGRGKNPSVDAIRELLGTGSKSTIAQHLRDWKAEQCQSSGKLPQDLFVLVTGLWERLNLQAEERIAEVKTTMSQELEELNEEFIKLQKDYGELQKQFHHSKETRVAEQSAKEKFEKELVKELVKEQQEQAKLLERHQANAKQLDDYKLENTRLHQLANNIQANLEHYQNAMQQLRTEQLLEMEKQQLKYQQEITNLQEQLTTQRQQLKEYEQQIAHSNAELKQLQPLHQQVEKMKQAMQNNSNELNLFKERNQQYQQQLQIINSDLSDKNKHIFECEKQMAILADQNHRLQNQLSSAEDKIELLRNEKLFLVQEKSTLQGHLNQLERAMAKKAV